MKEPRKENLQNKIFQSDREEYLLKLEQFFEKRSDSSTVVNYALDFYKLLIELEKHDNVRQSTKMEISEVINYYISALDLIPEAIFGGYGYLDDIYLSAWLIKNINPTYEKEIFEVRKKLKIFKKDSALVTSRLMENIIRDCKILMRSDDIVSIQSRYQSIIREK